MKLNCTTGKASYPKIQRNWILQPRKCFQFQRIPSEFSLSKGDIASQPNPFSTRAREQGAGVTKCKWQKFRGTSQVAARIGKRKIAGPCFALVEAVINERHVEITSRPGRGTMPASSGRWCLVLIYPSPSSNASHRPPLWRSSLPGRSTARRILPPLSPLNRRSLEGSTSWWQLFSYLSPFLPTIP